jgi:hypothetical protein
MVMKLAVRPYALAGIVLVAAGIVVANPVKPSLPQVEVPATQLTTETLPFETGDISTELEILAPGVTGPDGLGIDNGTGEVRVPDGFNPAPLQVDVFPSPQDYAWTIAGPNSPFPALP